MDNIFQIISASITDKGLSEKRPQNEDSFLEMGHCGIYAVADGVGGAEGGEVASQMAMEILGEAFANKPDDTDAEEILKNAIESANAAIYQTAQELSKLSSMATTIVALHIDGNVATIGHVGDSRLYRIDRQGSLHRETEDHSMVADEVRAGRMTKEQAENHPSKNVINRALGAEPIVEVDLKTILIEPGTSFLLCSDGITRHATDDEIREIFNTETNPTDICEYLKTLCFERGAEDNLTAVVIRVSSNAESQKSATDILESESDEEDTVSTARDSYATPSSATNDLTKEERDIVEIENAYDVKNTRAFSNTGNLLSLSNSSTDAGDSSNSGSIAKAFAAIGLLLAGSLIGFGLYHFFFVPVVSPQQALQFSEMKSDNIAVTSFEKLRRTVNEDPVAYLKEIPPARDAEDFYLQGRAYLLIGDYGKARSSLLEAQKQLSNSDPSNSKILATDISAALVIANDVEMQRRFRGELENTSKSFSNSSTNTNVSR